MEIFFPIFSSSHWGELVSIFLQNFSIIFFSGKPPWLEISLLVDLKLEINYENYEGSISYRGCSSYSLLLCGNTAQKQPEEERVYLAHRLQSIIGGSWGKTSSRDRVRTHGGKLLAGSTFTALSVCCLIKPGSCIQRWHRPQWAGPFHNHHYLRNTYRPTWWKKGHNWGFFFPGGCSLLHVDKTEPAQGSCGGSCASFLVSF